MTLSFARLRKPVYWWIIGYAVLWIIVSYLFDPTVPYDAVEAVNWGTNGGWGSPKTLGLLVLLCGQPFMVVLILAFIGILSTL